MHPLNQMQRLTQTNLEILNGINGALRGDATSTKVEINGEAVDPSLYTVSN